MIIKLIRMQRDVAYSKLTRNQDRPTQYLAPKYYEIPTLAASCLTKPSCYRPSWPACRYCCAVLRGCSLMVCA